MADFLADFIEGFLDFPEFAHIVLIQRNLVVAVPHLCQYTCNLADDFYQVIFHKQYGTNHPADLTVILQHIKRGVEISFRDGNHLVGYLGDRQKKLLPGKFDRHNDLAYYVQERKEEEDFYNKLNC